MQFQTELDNLSQELTQIKSEYKNILDRSAYSITCCHNVLYRFKKKIVSYQFVDSKQEIHFFKVTKQVPLVELIYFSEIHSFELQFPKADQQAQLAHTLQKIEKLNRFFLYNLDFGRYVRSGSKDFDEEFYTRKYLDLYYITTSKFYFQDPDFCTPRDMLLAKYNAYQKLIFYFKKRLEQLKNGTAVNFSSSPKKLPWVFSHTDWVELVYALFFAGLNHKTKLSISEVSKQLQQVFDYVPPRKVYRVYQEIKNRKRRTVFLEQLQKALLTTMDESEK